MARTPYPDPEAEKAYQDIADGSTKVAGDVIEFPKPSLSPNTDAVKNDIARRSGAGGPNVIKIPNDRYK